MNRTLILMTIIAMSITLAGCPVIDPGDGPDYPDSDREYHTGKEGVEFSFQKGNPPRESYENEKFNIVVELQNKGAFRINDGILLLGYPDDYMELQYGAENSMKYSLEGKSMSFPEGESRTVTFPAMAKELDPQSAYHDLALTVTSCYNYRTDLIETVCINMDRNRQNPKEQVCEDEIKTYKNGQGAPVAITRLESETLTGNMDEVRPQFKIYVDNQGNGKPINRYKIENVCGQAGVYGRDFNMVFLTEFRLSGESMKYDFNGFDLSTYKELDQELGGADNIRCRPNPLIIDQDNPENNHFTCIVDSMPLEESSYTTQMYVKLDYGYSESIATSTRVEDGEYS
jgi:hypothetical protein